MPEGRRVVFLGPGQLQLKPPDGEFFEAGAIVTMPDIQRANLAASGLRFGAVPDEPEPEPAPDPPPPLEPAETSAAVMEATAPARAPAATKSKGTS